MVREHEWYLNNDLGKKEIKQLKDMLTEASDLYYNSERRSMSDQMFEDLRDRYEEVSGNSFEIGSAPKKGKGVVDVDHSFGHLVGSQTKVNNIEQLKEWMYDQLKAVEKKRSASVRVKYSLKYDGNSVVIEYIGGKPVKALTRGKDGRGMDLTHIFKNHTIVTEEHVGIKYEVVITYEDFDKLMEEHGGEYANPRSMVAGKLGDDDAVEYAKYFTLVPLAVAYKDQTLNGEEQYEFIVDNFYDENSALIPNDFMKVSYVATTFMAEGTIEEIADEISDHYEYYKTARLDLEFMIDGLIIEFMDDEFVALGSVGTANKPRYARALKFPYLEKESTVVGFDFPLGKSGRITPRVWFEPVEFYGAIQQKVSLANYKRFQELGLGIGSKILVQYRNDTLSYVEPLDLVENEGIEPYPFASACPVCSSDVAITTNDKGEQTFAECSSPQCEGKMVGQIENYLTKMDIKGIKASTIDKLKDAQLLTGITDLYVLDPDAIAEIEGLGKKSAKEIITAVQKVGGDLWDEGRVPYDYEIIGSLSIKNFGRSKAKILCAEYTFTDLMETSVEKIAKAMIGLAGFNKKTADQFAEGWKNNLHTIEYLYNNLAFAELKDELAENSDDVLYTFCVTGSVETWSNRDALKKELELRGHKVSGSVSANTDYLINNDKESSSTKNKKARDLGKPIIGEQELRDLLNL